MKFVSVLFSAFLFLTGINSASASDSLIVKFNKQQFAPGDTLSFNVKVPDWADGKKSGTLNLWIEDVHHKGLWKLRYPVLQGRASADIILPDSLPKDIYAFYFFLQDDFFGVKGKVAGDYKGKKVRYVIMLDDKQLVADETSLDENMQFKLPNILFKKQATIFFSPQNPKKKNTLGIKIETRLDSPFTKLADSTCMINIGKVNPDVIAQQYQLNPTVFSGDTGTLQTVTVIGKRKTAADKFEEEYVSGFFRSNDGYNFDGLESNQFVGWNSILEWLNGRVAGLSARRTDDGTFDVRWRNASTELFLDEIPADEEMLQIIPTADIAYVKIYRPPFFGAFGGGGGGAVAVYTKRGPDGGYSSGPKHRFLINGYTPVTSTLSYSY